MTTYSFSTITAAQALALTASDTVLVDQGPANATAVVFATDTISMTLGAQTVAFSLAIASATKTYADGSRLFIGTTGNDGPAAFGAESNGLYGGAGADTLSGGGGANQLQGNQGEDSLVGGSGYDVIYGGQDNDTIAVGGGGNLGGLNFAQGNKGDDTISGAAGDNDTLLGGQGNDVIGATGRGPATTIDGVTFYLGPTGLSGGGNDMLNGNLGDDVICAGTGDDTLLGEDGADQLSDIGGRNVLDGGNGDDVISASGECTISAGAGNDILNLGVGAFVVSLGDGDDLALNQYAGRPGDHFTVDGGAGNDHIVSGDGSDSVDGGAGADTIDASGGADTIAGGAGADQFAFYGGESFTLLAGLDQIVDWASEDVLRFDDLDTGTKPGEGSTANYAEGAATTYDAALALANARVAGGMVVYVAVQVGADVFVFADTHSDHGVADTALKLVGRTLADISAANFIG